MQIYLTLKLTVMKTVQLQDIPTEDNGKVHTMAKTLLLLPAFSSMFTCHVLTNFLFLADLPAAPVILLFNRDVA